MNHNSQEPTAQNISENDVINFLRANPRLLAEYPDLLSDIVIPHQTGSATSLVERQVSVLREQLRQSKNQLKDLIGIAHTNTELTNTVHITAEKLINSDNIADTIKIIRATLVNDFKADKTVLSLFTQAPSTLHDANLPEFSPSAAADLVLFADVLESRQAICGRLASDQHQRLFTDSLPEYASAVLLPLNGKNWQGVLAIGSQKPERFQKDMATDILRQLSDLVTLSLNPYF